MKELLDHLVSRLERKGLDSEKAFDIAKEAVEAVSDVCGGRQVYFPMGVSIRTALRDEQIMREFNGRNIDDLSRRYRLSHARIYQILDNHRKGRRQSSLP
ncbi:Mor transcription activator family protein [Methylohalobius crimeensis]|uniref:Mor transcription activator family protein n=1 Tax=Methylohalobius crimeensis TaxID=244365 RepID=UPI000428175B|nr:Mor transcription activator family protein [Methylohalobius crimeensis]